MNKKILLIAPFPGKVDGPYKGFPHSFCGLLKGSAGYFWARALRKLGHNVTVFIENENPFISNNVYFKSPLLYKLLSLCKKFPKFTYFEHKLRTIKLKNLISKFKPEFIFTVEGNLISNEVLTFAKKEFATVCVQRLGADPWFFNMKTLQKNLNFYDFIFTQKRFLIDKVQNYGFKGKIFFDPLACDPEYHRRLALNEAENFEYAAEVCFVGAYYKMRDEIFSFLLEKGINLKVWGNGWENSSVHKSYKAYRGAAYGEKLVKIYSANKIALNPHLDKAEEGGNMRCFEIPACGALQISNLVPGLDKIFTPDKEIVVFKSNEELLNKINFYLKNEAERLKIVDAAMQKVLTQYTYEKKMLRIFKLLEA